MSWLTESETESRNGLILLISSDLFFAHIILYRDTIHVIYLTSSPTFYTEKLEMSLEMKVVETKITTASGNFDQALQTMYPTVQLVPILMI